VSYYDQMTACENKQEKLEQIACEVHERRVQCGAPGGLERRTKGIAIENDPVEIVDFTH
jgi:hypothetical protein